MYITYLEKKFEFFPNLFFQSNGLAKTFLFSNPFNLMIFSISRITLGTSVIVTILAPKIDDESDGIDLPAPFLKKKIV